MIIWKIKLSRIKGDSAQTTNFFFNFSLETKQSFVSYHPLNKVFIFIILFLNASPPFQPNSMPIFTSVTGVDFFFVFYSKIIFI